MFAIFQTSSGFPTVIDRCHFHTPNRPTTVPSEVTSVKLNRAQGRKEHVLRQSAPLPEHNVMKYTYLLLVLFLLLFGIQGRFSIRCSLNLSAEIFAPSPWTKLTPDPIPPPLRGHSLVHYNGNLYMWVMVATEPILKLTRVKTICMFTA